MTLAPGARLGSYRILESIGAGGMGEVYRARHTRLGRDVAIKVLPAEVSDDRVQLARFEREARTASALNHRNIVTIHDIAHHEGSTYIAMELVEGRTLSELLTDGPLPVDEAVGLAFQICEGLAVAHAADIVHRDVKPSNVIVTRDRVVKLLDFGLAKPLASSPVDDVTALTTADEILGTPHYMSPEQLSSEPVDHRSDQFAFGVLLYEMLAGTSPFAASSLPAVMSAILTRPAPPLSETRSEVPDELDTLVRRCLEKDPANRFPSMSDVGAALSAYIDPARGPVELIGEVLRRPTVTATALTVLVVALAAGVAWRLGAERRWAETEAMGEITSLIEQGDLFGAYQTILRAEQHRPGDPELDRVLDRITLPVTIRTEPPGATVYFGSYDEPGADSLFAGTTPLSTRVPYQLVRWHIVKDGFEPFVGAPFGGGSLQAFARGFVLDSLGQRPEGTVRVPAGATRVPPMLEATPLPVRSYYLDRTEVTNGEFAAFVRAGGYANPEWWPAAAMRRLGEEPTFEEAVDGFRDPTGRYGPATWELGDHPPGEDRHPVRGISWFEAAAYCNWQGKSLPTLFHWYHAVGQDQRSEILRHSNIDGGAPAPVGSFTGITAYGALDMAGNVKEWTWNAADDDRYILGGAWNEPGYLFKQPIARDPWTREPTYGMRCALYPEPIDPAHTEPVRRRSAYPTPEPVDDEGFEIMASQYAYDPRPLESRVEGTDSLPGYRKKTVSIRTASGDERMPIHLLLPHDAEPPYQTVVWFPGDDVFALRSSDDFSSEWMFDFLPRAGRAVAVPVYRGMYERFEPWERTPNAWRDMVVSWAREIGRTIDYLETDPDFEADKVAYYGFSAGALYAVVFGAVEPRLGAVIFVGGGLPPANVFSAMNPVHFAPRMDTPTLMINGENDFLVPYETHQRPFFEMLGAADDRKRHARLPGGHIPADTRDIIREVLDWLDRFLGPVQ